ncbi:WhiB family transcriptional regulator [Kitasatospora acidiphila]|uniref:WhiB family transcriptional regulator n=1 Tax=Kitasatospora acidiphila TaxID=2567942 RepID=UPI003C762FB9
MPKTVKRGDARKPCADYPLSTFFPDSESKGGKPTAGEAAALRVCGQCPIAARGACLEDALRYPLAEQYGVVGGTTAAQRRLIIRARRAASAVEDVLVEVA